MTRFARGGPANKKKPLPASSWSELKGSSNEGKSKVRQEESSKSASGAGSAPRLPKQSDLKHKKKNKKKVKSRIKECGLDSVLSAGETVSQDISGSSVKGSDTPENTNVAQLLESAAQPKKTRQLFEMQRTKKQSKKKKVRYQQRHSDDDADEPNLVKSLGKHDKHEALFGERTHSKSLSERLQGLISNPSEADIKEDLQKHIFDSMTKDFNVDEGQMKQEFKKLMKKDDRRENRRLNRAEDRQQAKLCFNCREPGHDMNNCPKVKQDMDQGSGICFKCGSTEHSVHKCRAKVPAGEYPYAKCFICGETGHLSKQCQDNPRGLYPNGGCCRHCSSVEHYKKDCPEMQASEGILDMKLDKWDAGKSVDDEIEMKEEEEPKKPIKKKPKIVKF